MNTQITKTISAFLFISFIFLGCGDSQNTVTEGYPDGTIEKLEWNTDGGGDLHFSITRDEDSFQIDVESYNFQEVDKIFVLTDEDPDIYGIVEDIFNRDMNIYDYVFTPTGETGTWTTLTLSFSGGQDITINQIQTWDNRLGDLYDFIENVVLAVPR